MAPQIVERRPVYDWLNRAVSFFHEPDDLILFTRSELGLPSGSPEDLTEHSQHLVDQERFIHVRSVPGRITVEDHSGRPVPLGLLDVAKRVVAAFPSPLTVRVERSATVVRVDSEDEGFTSLVTAAIEQDLSEALTGEERMRAVALGFAGRVGDCYRRVAFERAYNEEHAKQGLLIDVVETMQVSGRHALEKQISRAALDRFRKTCENACERAVRWHRTRSA